MSHDQPHPPHATPLPDLHFLGLEILGILSSDLDHELLQFPGHLVLSPVLLSLHDVSTRTQTKHAAPWRHKQKHTRAWVSPTLSREVGLSMTYLVAP